MRSPSLAAAPWHLGMTQDVLRAWPYPLDPRGAFLVLLPASPSKAGGVCGSALPPAPRCLCLSSSSSSEKKANDSGSFPPVHVHWEALPCSLTHQIPGCHPLVRNTIERIPDPLAGGRRWGSEPCVFQIPSRGPCNSFIFAVQSLSRV